MTIVYDEASQTFHLQSRTTSYIMQLIKSKYLAHVHWGGKVRGMNLGQLLATRRRCSFSPSTDSSDLTLSLDTLPQELPGFGGSDFRVPAYQVQLENGTTVSELVYDHIEFMPVSPLWKVCLLLMQWRRARLKVLISS